ncbi:hypothetical protein EYZ11_010331 [Aspergillus tanneri]|uniref:Xylanolytic transcriptional activator regulatory domain-containing protein n=1 Tax=Aspergillus tanneri TaxID=1220188 RepID=A0A4S3JAZ8_9EURO|nr:hypothetical protein EYZ11_010331 [Aspergillus tanneri]
MTPETDSNRHTAFSESGIPWAIGANVSIVADIRARRIIVSKGPLPQQPRAILHVPQQGIPHRRAHSPRAPWVTPGDSARVFLGESSPLTCVIDEGRRSPEKGSTNVMQMTRLHYPIPERLESNSTRDEAIRVHKAKLEAQLTAEGGTIPPLLLQAIFFIGVSLCTDEELARTEFEIRYQAKFHFYSKAKAVFDADWESDKTIKLQALFLLSYWRGGPSEERDTRFWLGVAISLAQKRGMHMMSKLSFHSSAEEKLWKRIWWALYIRDQQSASALGLPTRIRDEDCDVAMLETSDIEENEAAENQSVFGTQNVEDVTYPVEMARLARILFAHSTFCGHLTTAKAPPTTSRVGV